MFCAHIDTVPHRGQVEVVDDEGVFRSRGDTILGADNKAAVAVFMELIARHVESPGPVGIELVLTVAEEQGLRGAKAFDASQLRSQGGLRPRPRRAGGRGDRLDPDPAEDPRRLHRRRGPRRDQARGRQQRDRRRGGGDQPDGARPARRGDDGERRPDPGRHLGQRRPGPLLDPRRGAQPRLRAGGRGGGEDRRRLRLGRERARLRRRRADRRALPRLRGAEGLGGAGAGRGGIARAPAWSRSGSRSAAAATPTSSAATASTASCSPTAPTPSTPPTRWSRRSSLDKMLEVCERIVEAAAPRRSSGRPAEAAPRRRRLGRPAGGRGRRRAPAGLGRRGAAGRDARGRRGRRQRRRARPEARLRRLRRRPRQPHPRPGRGRGGGRRPRDEAQLHLAPAPGRAGGGEVGAFEVPICGQRNHALPPVRVLPLHGHLAPAAWAAAQAAPGLRVGYVQTGGGALPGSLSRDVEAAARARPARRPHHRRRRPTAANTRRSAPSAPSTPPPSSAGTRSSSAPAQGSSAPTPPTATAAWPPSTTPTPPSPSASRRSISPRLSSSDPRDRHRGLSHHTRTVLDLLLAPVDVAVPRGEPRLATASQRTRSTASIPSRWTSTATSARACPRRRWAATSRTTRCSSQPRSPRERSSRAGDGLASATGFVRAADRPRTTTQVPCAKDRPDQAPHGRSPSLCSGQARRRRPLRVPGPRLPLLPGAGARPLPQHPERLPHRPAPVRRIPLGAQPRRAAGERRRRRRLPRRAGDGGGAAGLLGGDDPPQGRLPALLLQAPAPRRADRRRPDRGASALRGARRNCRTSSTTPRCRSCSPRRRGASRRRCATGRCWR